MLAVSRLLIGQKVVTACECGRVVSWNLADIRGEGWKHWGCPSGAVNAWSRDVIERLIWRDRLRFN